MKLIERLESVRQIFLDTAPVIYFVEKNPDYLEKSRVVFSHLDEGKITAVVSPITLSECLVVPYRLDKADVVQVFTDLRAHYNLTLTDAFQLAVAIQSECDAFLTNDIDLKRVTEIPVIVLSEAE